MPSQHRFLPALTALGVLFSSSAALAQSTTGGPAAAAKTQPASALVINDLSLTQAVSICELAVNAKVPVETSLPMAARSMAFVIKSVHGSQITDSPVLEGQQLFNGSLVEIITKVKAGCYAKLPAADQKTVDALVADVEKALKQPAAPAK